MSDSQEFEFKGNALIHFRVRVTEKTLNVSTHKKRGEAPVRTWILMFTNVAEVRIDERIGANTRIAGVYMKPKHGDLTFFGWAKNALGSSQTDGKIFYDAAVAALRALAAQRPEMEVAYGPMMRVAHLIGASIGAALGVYLVMTPTGDAPLPITFGLGALVIALAIISVIRSGVFAKRRRMLASEAADLLEQHSRDL